MALVARIMCFHAEFSVLLLSGKILFKKKYFMYLVKDSKAALFRGATAPEFCSRKERLSSILNIRKSGKS